MREINQRVREVRKKRNYTQEKLAKLLGFKTSTYSQKEREGKIDCETLKKIAEILNVSADYLLYGEDTSEEEAPEQPKTSVNPETPIVIDIYDYLDFEEQYIILTYRNLSPKEQKEAYRLFIENFNINTIHKKRREQHNLKKSINKNSSKS